MTSGKGEGSIASDQNSPTGLHRREEAISIIWGAYSSVDSQFSASREDSEEIYAEGRRALSALGVTEAELVDWWDK